MNYTMNSMRHTNEHINEITNEWEHRNLNPDVQKSNNLSEVDYDDGQTRNAMLMLAENSSIRNEFANK